MKHKINPIRYDTTFSNNKVLHISIKTERLCIRSILPCDEHDCIKLLGDPIVMKKVATGIPFEKCFVLIRFEEWLKQWKNHDPFSVYAVLEKNSKEFVGIIAFAHTFSGVSEISGAFHKKFWGNGYGMEIADAVSQSLIPRIMLRGYKLDHKPLKKIIATARFDNPASNKILIGSGFSEENKIYKFDAWRHAYFIYAKSLKNEYHNFFTRRDRKRYKKQSLKIIDTDVDITIDEMRRSSFGQQSYTAKKI